MRKVQEKLEANLAGASRNNKKGFYMYVTQKRQIRESVPTLMSHAGKLVTTDKERAEVLCKLSLQSSLATSLPTPIEWVNRKRQQSAANLFALIHWAGLGSFIYSGWCSGETTTLRMFNNKHLLANFRMSR